MEFEFSNEQRRQLHEAVRAFLEKEFAFGRLRALKRTGSGRDPALWRGLAELGVPALNAPAGVRRLRIYQVADMLIHLEQARSVS